MRKLLLAIETLFLAKYLIFHLMYRIICKMVTIQVRIKPDIFYSFSQPGHFSRFKPDNLLPKTARFSDYNLGYNLTFLLGMNLQVQTQVNIQVSSYNPTLQA